MGPAGVALISGAAQSAATDGRVPIVVVTGSGGVEARAALDRRSCRSLLATAQQPLRRRYRCRTGGAERQLAVGDADVHRVAFPEPALQRLHRQRIEQPPLDRPPQRPRRRTGS